MIVKLASTSMKNWWYLTLVIFYLFAFAFGGASREGLEAHMILYTCSWFAAGFVLALRYETLVKAVPKMPFILLVGLFIWGLVTMVPLPADWFEGHIIYDNLLAERKVLYLDIKWITLSASPLNTLRSLLTFGSGVFAFLCTSLMTDKQRQMLLYGILFLGVISILIGAAQIFIGRYSSLYFWDISNRGFAVGIFANTNHQTSFAALLIPLLLIQVARNGHRLNRGDQGLGIALLFLSVLALILIGVIIGGSLAGYCLAVFGFVLSMIFIKPLKLNTMKDRVVTLIGGLIFIFGIAIWVFSSPTLYNLGVTSFGDGGLSRINTYRLSLKALGEYFYTGTGLGSFPTVFPFYENAQTVSKTFMNHVHNDWLEWALELGIVGIILLSLFVIWLVIKYTQLFFGKEVYSGKRLSKSAAICVCMLAFHSVVDYPLRTPFLALLFFTLLGVSVTKSYNNQEELESTKLNQVKI